MSKLYKTISEKLKAQGDKAFCVPLALSCVTDKDIDEVNSILGSTRSKRIGRSVMRKKGRGVATIDYLDAGFLKTLGVKATPILTTSKTVCTIQRELYSTKKYLICVKGHVLAMTGGEIHDWTEGKRNRVQEVYRVDKLDEPTVESTPIIEKLKAEGAKVTKSGRWTSIKFPSGGRAIKTTLSRGQIVVAVSNKDVHTQELMSPEWLLKVRKADTTFVISKIEFEELLSTLSLRSTTG